MKKYAFLVAGLGNPGEKYDLTRHNYGFMAVDKLVDKAGGHDKCPELALRGDCITHDCKLVKSLPSMLLAKPQTFMNLSGVAVGKLASKLAIAPEHVLVVHDDLDLPLGRMKLKKGGGDAGHNGIKSITEHLGTPSYLRLRLGIGRPERRGGTADYVLEPFTAQEMEIAAKVLEATTKGMGILLRKGVQQAMQHFNGFSAIPSEDPKSSLD